MLVLPGTGAFCPSTSQLLTPRAQQSPRQLWFPGAQLWGLGTSQPLEHLGPLGICESRAGAQVCRGKLSDAGSCASPSRAGQKHLVESPPRAALTAPFKEIQALDAQYEPAALNWGNILFPRGPLPRLETFWLSRLGEGELLASSG